MALRNCPDCGKQISDRAAACPNCGAPPVADESATTPQLVQQVVTPTESAKLEGVVIGTASGCLTSVLLFVGGGLLCATGIGALIGVPMIIGAILAPIVGPLLGLAHKKGRCPNCQGEVSVAPGERGTTCGSCKRRIVYRDGKLLCPPW